MKVAGAQWWLPVEEANWRKPEGGHSNILDRFVTFYSKCILAKKF